MPMQQVALGFVGIGFCVGVTGVLVGLNGHKFGRYLVSSGVLLISIGMISGFLAKIIG